MDIQTKHRVTLLNAKCNYVCAVDTLVKKSNYGEDVDCCVNKLFLAAKLINRLECFCFETPTVETNVNAVLELDVPNNSFLSGTIVQFTVNNIQVYGYTSTAESKVTVTETMLDSLGFTYTEVDAGAYTRFTIDFECNVTEASYIITKSKVTTQTHLTVVTAGACSVSNPICYNCIEVSDLPKMYEVLHKLLQ